MTLILFLLIVFGFNFIQVIAAFGGTMIAMPFAILLLGPEDAKLTLTAISMLGCVYPIVQCRNHLYVPQIIKMVVLMGIGVLIAQVLGESLYSPVILIIYSLMVICVAIFNFTVKRDLSLPKAIDNIVLVLAGLIQGAFLSGGSLVAIYAMRNFKEKDELRGSMSVIWLVINGVILVTNILKGAYTEEVIRVTSYSIVPAVLGLLVGDFFQKRLDQARFRWLVNCLLILSGIILLINCL